MTGIIAINNRGVIGRGDSIPWRCREDFQWFKQYTMGKTLIMGRKTYQSLLKLKGRNITILTRSPSQYFNAPRWYDASLEAQFEVTNSPSTLPSDGIVAGGAEIYKLLMPKIKELYVSWIDNNENEIGDVKAPSFRHYFKHQDITLISNPEPTESNPKPVSFFVQKFYN